MKITSSRKDEILKRKAKYEEDLAAYRERESTRDKAFHSAESEVLDPIRQYLERKLARYSMLKFDVHVERNYMKGEGAAVNISCNEHNKFDPDVALSWSFRVILDKDGQVVRESSSWSGLSATTEEQMQSLRQTVSALDFLNDVDWADLIDVKMPEYKDYYDFSDKPPEREDFEGQLQAAELEELVGANKIVEVKNWGESCPYRGPIYLHIVKETPSMYMAHIIPKYIADGAIEQNLDSYKKELRLYTSGERGEYRIRKTSVRPVSPMNILEV